MALGNYNNPNATGTRVPESISYETVSENITFYNGSGYGSEQSSHNYVLIVIAISMLVICTFGAVGNGIVFCLLSFCIQRNPFLTYILNLTVADFGVVFSVIVVFLYLWSRSTSNSDIVSLVFIAQYFFMSSSSQFLLTAISIDRGVAVFFPLWHQCKRPPHLSNIVCAVIWVFSFLLTMTTITLSFFVENPILIIHLLQPIVNAVLCVPLMTIATVALFIKICFKAQQHRRRKLLTTVLLTLLFFLFCAFPLNIVSILSAYDNISLELGNLAMLLSCLNSCVNPVIYFLVGRQWKSRQKESLRMILQKAFKEEEGGSGQQETPAETQL